jgi:hypothetical protein
MRRAAFLIAFAVLSATRLASAAEIYNEATSGDLSNDRLAPTPLSVGLGSNTLTATSVSGDREYFRFTVPPGRRLNAIVNVASNGTRSFLGMQNGSVFTEPPTATVATNLLGYSHFGSGDATIGTDILDNMAASNGYFTGGLAAGDYVFWSQETGGVATTYTFDFQIGAATTAAATPIPPVFGGLLALGLLGLGCSQMVRAKREPSVDSA